MTKTFTMVLFHTVCILIALVGLADAAKRVCYYSNWSQYRPGSGRFMPLDIPSNLCTHLIYSFAKVNSNYELDKFEWNDFTLYQTFNDLKKNNPDLKTLLATGGWNAGSIFYSKLVSNRARREKFAKQAIQFVREKGFDGFDLDWEYPARRGGAATDKENFIQLIKDLKHEIDLDTAANPDKSRLLLTAAVAAGKDNIDPAYDIPAMGEHLDFINLMSYDLHGAWENVTGHNSPLFSRSGESGDQEQLNVDWAAKYWVSKGCPREKLIIGLPTYGRHFQLSDISNTGFGAPARGPGTQGPKTRENGFLAYYEVCKLLANGGQRKWNNEHMVPYLVNGDQWVGYDDEESFRVKLNYIKENGYGGAMVWNIDLDDFNKQCSLTKERYPLMRLMGEILDSNTPATSARPGTSGVTEATSGVKTEDSNGAKRVCYYSNWSQYRPGSGRFMPSDIPPNLCTHLIYSFAKVNSNYELDKFEWNDFTLYQIFNDLKKNNPDLKTLLATGGWNAGSIIYSQLVRDRARREKFAKQAIQFVREKGFDGFDLDWEYPVQRGGAATDKKNFIQLIKDLKHEIDLDAAANLDKSRLLLTAAVAAGKDNIDPAYDIPAMGEHLDFINLMSYDLHGAWEKVTGHNSPLFSRSGESGGQEQLSVDWAAKYWVSKGCPREKLIIGLPTYGRHFQLSDTSNTGFGAPARGPGTQGPKTRENGFLAYYEICELLANGGQRKWNNEHKVPYLVNGDQWVGYDDEESFRIKLNYIKDNGYGGAMVWNIDLDDFNKQCSLTKERYPLMRLMGEILDSNTPATTARPGTTSTSENHRRTD